MSDHQLSGHGPDENNDNQRSDTHANENAGTDMANTQTPTHEDPLDAALLTMVTSYTDSAPAAPDVNDILVARAARPKVRPPAGQRWLRPALLGVMGLVVLGGGVAAVRAASNADGGQTIVPADPTEDSTPDVGGDDEGQPAPDGDPTDTDNETDGQTDNEAGSQEAENPPQADLGTLAGSGAAGDLPDAAPATYWAVTSEDAELVQVDARTGKILANAGGWGPQELGEGDLGQALQQPEVASDGTVYVDDCCEPAFGNVFRLGPDDVFAPGQSAWQTGIYPSVSPSGRLVMVSVGGSLQMVTSDGDAVASIGTPDQNFNGVQYIPLAWIDEQTIVVRMFDTVEEIRIYELADGSLVERTDARRVAPDRFHMDAAVRADGMVVLATRRPNGNALGLAGGGDLVGEVLDPATGELVTEFDLPDLVFDIDYDSTGRFLIASGDHGTVHWFGAGGSGVLAEGVIGASWD